MTARWTWPPRRALTRNCEAAARRRKVTHPGPHGETVAPTMSIVAATGRTVWSSSRSVPLADPELARTHAAAIHGPADSATASSSAGRTQPFGHTRLRSGSGLPGADTRAGSGAQQQRHCAEASEPPGRRSAAQRSASAPRRTLFARRPKSAAIGDGVLLLVRRHSVGLWRSRLLNAPPAKAREPGIDGLAAVRSRRRRLACRGAADGR